MNDDGIQRGLGRVEGKVDSIVVGMTSLLESQGSLNKRITAVEAARKSDRAFVGGISAAVSSVVVTITLFLKYGGFG